ncbi:MAG: DNA/RNA nuclease SfsA, partial [Candidatus Omnitrophica bacterium]|nr:DNA/RNA nuclease SfsA [Candidatus Omnitrophota bacterium]
MCQYKKKRIKAYLANSGRLSELLLPHKKIYLLKDQKRFRVLATEKYGYPVVLDTSLSNRIAGYLIESGAVPNFKNAKIISSEVKIGRSRFDLLLENKNKRIVLEVKTCTLFNKRLAMFPDAKTERGRRQLEDLVKLSQNGTKGAILFLVHSYFPYLFLPNYHTDLDFSLTLLNSRKKIKIIALGLFWDKDFSLKKFKILKIPWRILRREAKDGGSYLLILELRKNTKIEVGSLGIVSFPKGFYIYVGKAEKNLLKRVSRHKRKLKKKHWHI